MASPRPARLRDTLYLETERVRALLAQLTGGIIEGIIERSGDRTERKLGAKWLGIEAGRTTLDDSSFEATSTLHDAVLDIFEEAAIEAGVLRDVNADDPDVWLSGSIQSELVPGQLIRLTAPTQIVDAEHVGSEMTRSLEMVNAWAMFQEALDPTPLPTPEGVPPQVRKQQPKIDPEAFHDAAITARGEALMGVSFEGAIAVKVMFEKLLGSGISVRCFPCGTDHREIAITGRLSSAAGNLRDEHDALFAKYGWGASSWTLIAQIATIPEDPRAIDEATKGGSGQPVSEPDDMPAPDVAGSADLETDDGGAGELEEPSRGDFEVAGIEFMKVLADAGLISAPRFPGITVTPIAIYREVPTAP